MRPICAVFLLTTCLSLVAPQRQALFIKKELADSGKSLHTKPKIKFKKSAIYINKFK